MAPPPPAQPHVLNQEELQEATHLLQEVVDLLLKREEESRALAAQAQARQQAAEEERRRAEEERQRLAAEERDRLAAAERRAAELLEEARRRAGRIVAEAEEQALQIVTGRQWARKVVTALAATGLLATLGAAMFVAPNLAPLAALAASLGALGLGLVAGYPVAGLLVLFFFTSSLIPPASFVVQLPVGRLDIRDLTFLVVLGAVAAREVRRTRLLVPWWQVLGPLLAVMGFGVYSLVYAFAATEVQANWALFEFRAVLYYASALMVAWSITRRAHLVVLLAGLFVVADLTAGVLVLQQFLGTNNPILEAMQASSTWAVYSGQGASDGFGAVRILPPGHVLMYLLATVALCLLLFVRTPGFVRLLLASQVALLNVALLLTYTRAQWLASIIAMLALWVILPGADRARLNRFGLAVVAGVLGLVVVAAAMPSDGTPFYQALADRAGSMLDPEATLETTSAEFRLYEAEKAVGVIAQNPAIGIGLGNFYRQPTLLQAETRGGTSFLGWFMHNSYLYIATKMGLLALATFLWFAGAFVVASWRVYRSTSDPLLRYLTVAVLVSFVGLLQWALSHPHFMDASSTVLVGLMVGLVAGCVRLSQPTMAVARQPLAALQEGSPQPLFVPGPTRVPVAA